MFKKLLLTLFIAISAFHALSALEEFGDYDDTLYLNLVERVDGDFIEVDFVVNGFDDIAGVQYTILHSEGLSFVSVESSLLNESNFGIFNDRMTFSWSESSTIGVSMPDGSIFYTLRFSINDVENPVFDIIGDPTPIEVIHSNFEKMVLSVNGLAFSFDSNLFAGTLFKDDNNNCEYDDGEIDLSGWLINIDNQYNISTNSDGHFAKYLTPGDHTIRLIPKNNLWSLCQEEFVITVDDGSNEYAATNLGVTAIVSCPRPEISTVTPFLRRCVDNRYYFTYCNYGTEEILAPEININFSEDFIYKDASITPQEVNSDYVLILGENLGIGECKNFSVIFELNCETTELGQTLCLESTIGPFENCIQSQDWSGAEIVVEAVCDEDQVKFKIKNVGEGDMGGPKSFIVIEDDVMAPQPNNDYDIDSGDSIEIGYPADGTTYRLIAEQEDNHPFPNKPTAALEGCGTDSEGNYSTGFITQFAESDNAPFEDVFCTVIIGSFDPNDKQGFPKGYGDEHYIYRDTDMEYLIRFQNTGNDTAFNVVITDSLRGELDLRSLQVGPASHPFTWEIQNESTLVFKFENILLPDSNVNLLGSNGFIKYKVKQSLDNSDGTVIENDAAIFFDFNEPIITNTTKHIIGSEFIVSDIIQGNSQSDPTFIIYPNPTSEGIWLEQMVKTGTIEFKIYNASGQLTYTSTMDDYLNFVERSAFGNGLHFYSVTTTEGKIYTGKIIILN